MRSGFAAAVLLTLLASCVDDSLVGSPSGIHVSAQGRVFPPTFVGLERPQSLSVSSTARHPQEVRVSVEGPFSVALDALVLAGGERRELLVTFAPPAIGAMQGALLLSSPAGVERIVLEGEGRALPDCGASRACVRIHVDPDTGACLETAIDEGLPCEDTCLADAACRAGACVGKSRDCSDGKACTDDLCEPGIGCQHVETRCTEPENPCQVAICDAALGCMTATVEDGTPCGEQACHAAHVCLAGACTVRKLPEGAKCGSESPCQLAGVCQAEQCVQPPATPLTPSWTIPAPAETFVSRLGTVDEEGNLYWIEAPRNSGASSAPLSPSCPQRERERCDTESPPHPPFST